MNVIEGYGQKSYEDSNSEEYCNDNPEDNRYCKHFFNKLIRISNEKLKKVLLINIALILFIKIIIHKNKIKKHFFPLILFIYMLINYFIISCNIFRGKFNNPLYLGLYSNSGY